MGQLLRALPLKPEAVACVNMMHASCCHRYVKHDAEKTYNLANFGFFLSPVEVTVQAQWQHEQQLESIPRPKLSAREYAPGPFQGHFRDLF